MIYEQGLNHHEGIHSDLQWYFALSDMLVSNVRRFTSLFIPRPLETHTPLHVFIRIYPQANALQLILVSAPNATTASTSSCSLSSAFYARLFLEG